MSRNYNPEDFVIQYPGVYPDHLKPLMDEYFERVRMINEREVTGADIVAGKVSSPKLSEKCTLTEEMLRHFNDKYAPEYKVNLDSDMAKKYGYRDIFAMVGMTACDEAYNYMLPPQTRDTVLVSQISSWIVSEREACAGDTLYMIRDKVEVHDLTPSEGSVYRHIYTKNYGTVYNQNGEIVSRVMFSLMESTKLYKDECLPKPRDQFGFPDMWEDPDWFSRPLHKYTDEDYEYFKDIWKNEVVRGEELLYWEDVNVGDRIPVGTFGPIKDGVIPLSPYGMGVGGSRNLKLYFLDPVTEKQMIADEITGIRQMPDPDTNTPPVPGGVELPKMDMPEMDEEPGQISTADVHGGSQLKSVLLNLMGRDLQVAYIQNYAGYHGKVKSVRWNLMPPDTHAALNKPVPEVEGYINYIQKVPGKENVTQTIHGCTTDAAIMHGEVIGKDIVGQEFLVKVITWIEDIHGDVWHSAEIEIALPSKNIPL